MKLIERPIYTEKLLKLINHNEVKILTGVHGAGKSSIIKLFQQKLILRGVEYTNIISDINDLTENKKRTYLFIDDIRQIKNWKKVISDLKLNFDVDIYINNSGKSVIDDELCQMLGHKPIEIEVFPLSFKESQSFLSFDEYLIYGGMPALLTTKTDYDIRNIFYSTLAQEVFMVNKIADNAIIISLIKMLLTEIGKIHSFNSLSKLFANFTDRLPSVKTIENYIKMLIDSKLFYAIPVFDIKNNMNLIRYAKYYPVDLSFYKIMFDNPYDCSEKFLESIVYFELLRLGTKVSTCKIGNKKVAFIAENEDNKIYIQVTKSIKGNEKNIFEPLRAINDHYSKWIITLDKVYSHSHDGIRIINLIDFLIDE